MLRSMAIADASTPARAASAPGMTPSPAHPLTWVPTSYLAMGLVYVTVGNVANIMLSYLGFDNKEAAFWSSALGVPYIIKPLWAPLVELGRSKKYYVVLMQLLIAGIVALAGLTLQLPARSFALPLLTL